MTDNPAEDRLDWVRSLVSARAPEIDASDIVEAYSIPTEPNPCPMWAEVMERMIDSIEALEQRLDRIEEDLRQR